MKAITASPYIESPRGLSSSKGRLYIATFGCQMNEYDSQQMAQILSRDYQLATRPEDADVIIVNTCSIREKAENKVYSLVGRFRRLKEEKPDLIIGIGGCVAQQQGKSLFQKAPYVDIVFGPQGVAHLPNLLREAKKGRKPVCFTSQDRDYNIPFVNAPLPEKNPTRAFVTIMQGCNNFCTYCVVPYVRGREVSRPAEDILSEIRMVIQQGVKEITLLGQNVNSYGKGTSSLPSFAELLKACSRVPGLERLRFTTSHPKDLTRDVMKCFRDLPNLCEHLHLPVQSGSTSVLKHMNRRYTRDDYLRLIDELRMLCPEITLTTDLIVGFPGETEKDFQQTISLLERVQFDQIFAFKYSPRPFTRAAGFSSQVPEDVKSRRLTEVLALQNEIGLRRYQSLEGKTMEVLVEGPNKTRPDELIARTRGNHVVNIPGPDSLTGHLVQVTVEKACYHSLRGKLTSEDESDMREKYGIDSNVCTCDNP